MNQSSPVISAVTASMPGKIFLAGEYAVLRGGPALAAAVGARLNVTVMRPDANSPLGSPGIVVDSNLWERPLPLDAAPDDEPLVQSLKFLRHRHAIHDATVTVASELPVAYGLGSSSAVRLGAHLAFAALEQNTLLLDDCSRWLAAREAWRLQAELQGFASGYDLVTQLSGGYIQWQPNYENWPGAVEHLDCNWLKDYVHPYAGGAGAPTTTVGGGVRRWLNDEPSRWIDLESKSSQLIEAFLTQNPEDIAAANTAHAALLRQAPFYPVGLYNLLAQLPAFGRSWTFKTTGAGGEDAILLIGHRSELDLADSALKREGWSPLPWTWTTEGSTLSAPLREGLV